MCKYTSEVAPLKKQYAQSVDHEWIPKIYCSMKHTQCIVSDGTYMASVPMEDGTEPALEAAKITILYQRSCCPSAIHSFKT